jgi:hypothetical protein
VSHFGEARRGDKTHVSRTDNCDGNRLIHFHLPRLQI